MSFSRVFHGVVATIAATALATAPLSAQSISQPAVAPDPSFAYGLGNPGGGGVPVFGQTFLASGPFLNSFSFWLSNEPINDLGFSNTPNADQLTFRAYIAVWDPIGRAGPVLFQGDAQLGPVGVSQRYTFSTGALALDAGMSYVAFLLVPDMGLLDASAAFEQSEDASAQGEFVLAFTNDLNALTNGDPDVWAGTGTQLRFAATFSQSATVPEPSTGVLLGGALLLLVAAGRRRQAATRA